MDPIISYIIKVAFTFSALGKSILSVLAVVLPIAISAFLGYGYAVRRIRLEKKLEFIQKQLEEFYSPISGCIKRVRASSQLRVELGVASGIAWQKICSEHPQPFEEHDMYFKPFMRQIEKENEYFPKYLIPLYDEMVEVFTKNYWLAEPSTREYYQPFCRFVELWHRYIDDAIPSKVLDEVEIEEASLEPFYADLDANLERLRQELNKA